LAQAAIASEDLASFSADRLRADGGEFVASVRFIEGTARNPFSAQAVDALEEVAFVGQGADNQMRVR
jgi:hypothetical protein